MIECDCGVEVDSCCEFSTVKRVKARKEHTCGECDEAIKIGDTYEYTRAMWEGTFDTAKTCVRCVGIRDTLCKSGYYYGQVREQVREACGIDYVTGEMEGWLMGDLADKYRKGEHIPIGVVEELKKMGHLEATP